jgi:hypothetical protein
MDDIYVYVCVHIHEQPENKLLSIYWTCESRQFPRLEHR